MYGVQDLLLHVMYVNKRENLEAMKHFAVEKMLIFALSACYKRGHAIQYDFMFEKSVYGAKSNGSLIKNKYKKYKTLNLDYGKCLKELEEDKELDEMIVKLIKVTNTDFSLLPKHIIGSKPYQKDIEEIRKTQEEESYFSTYPYWTKRDILELLSDGEETNVKIDNRIPLNKKMYSIMSKFLRLQDSYKSTEEFTRDEIMEIHNMPYHLIRSIEENGCYYDPKVN